MCRISCSTDMSDKEWALIEQEFPMRHDRGRPPKYSYREIVDAIFYVMRTGCQWRLLPHDFPNWHTV